MTNGSGEMEKPVEEILSVLRGRDHRGGRVPEDRQQMWPIPVTFWTQALVLYCSVWGSRVLKYRILHENVQWSQHVRKQLPLRVECKCPLFKRGPGLSTQSHRGNTSIYSGRREKAGSVNSDLCCGICRRGSWGRQRMLTIGWVVISGAILVTEHKAEGS